MITETERSIEDINEVLQQAKLKEEDVMPTSQVIYFTDKNLHDNNFRLIELDPHIAEQINQGKPLYIKGDDDENVVLCSETRTYNVVETETSNSLLLVDCMKTSKEIEGEEARTQRKVTVKGIFYEYLEPIAGKPNLKKLYKLLEPSLYRGPESEYLIDTTALLSWDELKSRIQASDKEFEEALESVDVIIINEKVRLLDFEYHFRVLSYMLKLIEENSWGLDEIDYDETVTALEDLVQKEVLHLLFNKYAVESKMIDGLQLYSYDERKVCQFYAKVLLHNAGRFNLTEFLQAWQESVPEGMLPNEEMLYGIAIIDRKSTPNVIWKFSEEELPENINERFRVLFETKEKWTVPEIAPYIKQLTTEKLDVNALLAKHARASKIDGVKYYSAKHAK